jgi:glycerophosphoryl diester phosphodiesterase
VTAPQHSPTPRIIAHRGASHSAPENTLAAFRAALAAGAEGVEFDVQASRDGVPVVIHDERLERTTGGTGWVRDHSASELGALEAGLWFDPPLRGEPVPTLAAVLALKTARVPYPGLVQAVLAELAAAGVAGRVVLSSFNHHTLREALRLAPHVPCAALLSDVLLDPWDYARRHGFQGLHPHHGMVDAAFVQGCRGAGLAVRPYTVDDPQEAQRLLGLGVDGLITNEPARLLALRGAPSAR